ncbi:MAG: methyltransferase domain-containing protein [Phycisphaerae bacterium]|nr:methyltransferase domain-containing protein [Phycisphaerae bacterium]
MNFILTKTKRLLRKIVPASAWKFVQAANWKFLSIFYRVIPRRKVKAETSRAKSRRILEGFFEKFCTGKGLDIGYGGDLLCSNCRGWDIEDGDAQTLKGLPDGSFDFVYSSHCLEHLEDAAEALGNWWRVLKQGGCLILYLPHRDLYERKKTLPSRWNTSHKRFFLLDRDELPDTIGILPLLEKTVGNYEIIKADICKTGYEVISENRQADGEYSIEAVIRKL